MVFSRAGWLPICVLSSLTLAPAEALAETDRWTLERAEQTALTQSPRVRSAQAARDTAYAYRTFSQVPRAGNPEINVRAMIGKPDDPAATYALFVGLPFDVAGKRRAWRSEARFVLQEADARLAATRNDVRAEAREAYVQVVLADAAQRVVEESATTSRELFERVQARLRASAATALDVTLAESQYAEAQADMQRARRALLETEDRFRQVLDLVPSTPIATTPLAPPSLPDGIAIEEAIAHALGQRQEIAAQQSAERRWRAADSRLRAEAVAPVTTAFEVERQGNHNPNSSVGAGVDFELPLLQRAQGERAVARKEAHAAALEGELTEHAVAREVATAYRRLEAALAELAALDERALPAAERTLAMVHTLLDSGAVDYFRLLSARSGAYQLRQRRVEALREAWLCRIALERATGGWEKLR